MKRADSQSMEGTSFERYIQKKLKSPQFREIYEIEKRKLRIGFLINQFRLKAGLTQVQLAQRVRVTQGYIARLETAETANYEIKTLRKIAKALDMVLVMGFMPQKEAQKKVERNLELVTC